MESFARTVRQTCRIFLQLYPPPPPPSPGPRGETRGWTPVCTAISVAFCVLPHAITVNDNETLTAKWRNLIVSLLNDAAVGTRGPNSRLRKLPDLGQKLGNPYPGN